jgi:hypothetical protein
MHQEKRQWVREQNRTMKQNTTEWYIDHSNNRMNIRTEWVEGMVTAGR